MYKSEEKLIKRIPGKWSSGYPRIPLALVLEFDSHRVEILNLFEKMQKKMDRLLKAPSIVGIHNSTSQRGKKMLNFSRDKKEGTYRSGEGRGGPAM